MSAEATKKRHRPNLEIQGQTPDMNPIPDNNSRDAKRAELVVDFQTLLGPDLSKYAERLANAFCEVSAPLDPPIVIEMITAHSGGRRGGQTRKPGNIVLNWRRFIQDSADLVLTGAGATTTPWLIPLAALSIFNKLWSHSSIDLTREQATCLYAMWHHCDKDHKIQVEHAHIECSSLFVVFDWHALERRKFDTILHDLAGLRCIEMPEPETIWLREYISTSYQRTEMANNSRRE
jgi:hypothetical protein